MLIHVNLFKHLLMGVHLKVVLYCILNVEAHVTMIQVQETSHAVQPTEQWGSESYMSTDFVPL